MGKRMPAWQRLVKEGFFQSRPEAERWILAGEVFAGNRRVSSAGEPLDPAEPLTVRNANARYVSKGGFKLEGPLERFGLDVSGKVCLDAGACTGGFTDCLVKHGASLVYAVDVGFGQLAGSLRQDPHVVNLERTNLSDPILMQLDPAPVFATADLSYLSLRKAVPIYRDILHGHGEILCLVKPLFEIEDAAVRRSGIVPDDAYVPLLLSLCRDLSAPDISVAALCASPVTGNNGTIEFFILLKLDPGPGLSEDELRTAAEQSAAEALRLPVYEKNGLS